MRKPDTRITRARQAQAYEPIGGSILSRSLLSQGTYEPPVDLLAPSRASKGEKDTSDIDGNDGKSSVRLSIIDDQGLPIHWHPGADDRSEGKASNTDREDVP